MRIEFNQKELCLKKNQLVKVRGGIGHTVLCHSGSIWVTQDGDPRDVVLGAGQVFTLDRSGPALLQAFESGSVSIRRAAPSAGATGLPAFLRAGIFGAAFARSGVRA